MEPNNNTGVRDANTLLMAAVVVVLLMAMGILGTARMYAQQKHATESATAKLTRTQQKLDYYMWRDSNSLGHSIGPEHYTGAFKP